MFTSREHYVEDEFGQAKYRVITFDPKEGGASSLLVQTLTPQGGEVNMSYEQLGTGESEVAYMNLDLGVSEPGGHYLEVEVTDLNNGQTVSKETLFMVVE